jgi:hypothetical protein
MATENAEVLEPKVEAPQVDAADEASDILKQEVAKARQAADQRTRSVEQRLAEMAAQKDRVEKDLHETRTQAATSQVEAYTRDVESAKAELQQAYEAGDFKKVTDAQEKLNGAQINKREFERQKQEFERPRPAQTEARRPISYSDDPAEQLAQEIEAESPNSADWVRQHPEYARDGAARARMTAAHHYAVSQGARIDSPTYFQVIEKQLGINQDDGAATSRASARTPAAPVSREAVSPARRDGPGKVTLTREQKETAAELGIPEDRYAFQVAQERANNPNFKL